MILITLQFTSGRFFIPPPPHTPTTVNFCICNKWDRWTWGSSTRPTCLSQPQCSSLVCPSPSPRLTPCLAQPQCSSIVCPSPSARPTPCLSQRQCSSLVFPSPSARPTSCPFYPQCSSPSLSQSQCSPHPLSVLAAVRFPSLS